MDAEILRQVGENLTIALLLYLVIRKEAIIDRMIERFEANERKHIDDIIRLCAGRNPLHDSEIRNQEGPGT